MTNELFTIRDARPDDKAVLDGYANLEGMDAIPSIEGVRVAVNEDDEVVGFVRIALADDGTAFVNPVITHETWRGFGVGRALMEEALERHGELRLVSRGGSLPFYKALGYERIGWDLIEMSLVDDCDHCEMQRGMRPGARAEGALGGEWAANFPWMHCTGWEMSSQGSEKHEHQNSILPDVQILLDLRSKS